VSGKGRNKERDRKEGISSREFPERWRWYNITHHLKDEEDFK